MTDHPFERTLGALIDEHSRAVLRPIDPYAMAEGAIADGRRARRPWRTVRPRTRRWPLLSLAAALLLPAGLFLAGNATGPEPSPTPSAVGWHPVVVRGEGSGLIVDDGTTWDRIREIDGLSSRSWIPAGGVVSPDGWLVLMTRVDLPIDMAWAVTDLKEPAGMATMLPPGGRYAGPVDAAWAPGGRLATTYFPTVEGPPLSVQITNASTGDIRRIDGLGRRPSDPLVWAADGSGLLTVTDRLSDEEIHALQVDDSSDLWWQPASVVQGIDHLGDGPRTLGVPELAWRPGPRQIVKGGTSLEWTHSPATGPSVVVVAPDATRTPWRVGDRTTAVSLTADGRSLLALSWAIRSDRGSSTLDIEIDRLDAPDGPLVRVAGGSLLLSDDDGAIRIDADLSALMGIAPDDSAVVIGIRTSDDTSRFIVVPMDGGQPRTLSGLFVGFVPSDLFPQP